MSGAPEVQPDDQADWPLNYFNYFTEIEEHFQRARGSGLFLLSPLDWALIENWKAAGVPLEAVIRGIDDAFEKWRSRKVKRRQINSVAYCTQAVMEAAQRLPVATENPQQSAEAPFSAEEVRDYLMSAAVALRRRPETPFQDTAASLETLAASAESHIENLEGLERRLAALEEKILGTLRSRQTEDQLYGIRERLDRELKPYRGKMTAEQLSMLERRYMDTALLEQAELPRFSLFYLH